MTSASVACPNGHHNPEHQHFCGECGAALLVTCRNGHRNPPHQHFCGECGARLGVAHETRQEPAPGPDLTEGRHRTPPDNQPRKEVVEQAEVNADYATPPRLKVGDRVQVVDPGDKCNGMVGIVREITNDTMRVDLDADVYRRFFLADFSRRAFRSDQLQLVGGAVQQPASQQFREIGAELFQSVRRDVLDAKRKQPFRQYLQGLSTGAKIGLAVAAVALAAVSIAALATHGFRDDYAYRIGYQYGSASDFYGTANVNGSDTACAQIFQLATVAQNVNNSSKDDFVEGCKAGYRSLGGTH